MEGIFSIIGPRELEILGRLVLAGFLAALLGMERTKIGKPAGVRTYALVALGAALYTVMPELVLPLAGQSDGLNQSQIISQIVTGIGFLGAGLIIHHGHRVEGLTTAAGLWVVAAIGVAIGLGLYAIGIFVTLVAFIIFWVVGHLEHENKNS